MQKSQKAGKSKISVFLNFLIFQSYCFPDELSPVQKFWKISAQRGNREMFQISDFLVFRMNPTMQKVRKLEIFWVGVICKFSGFLNFWFTLSGVWWGNHIVCSEFDADHSPAKRIWWRGGGGCGYQQLNFCDIWGDGHWKFFSRHHPTPLPAVLGHDGCQENQSEWVTITQWQWWSWWRACVQSSALLCLKNDFFCLI